MFFAGLFIRGTLSTDGGSSEMIGSILLTARGRILLFDADETLLVNQTFPHMESLPVKSAMSRYQTARMTVIKNFAYIGGRDGVIYRIKLPVDYLDAVSTGASSHLAGKYVESLNIFNITLPFSCIVEVFTYTQADGVIAACFNNTNSTLYIVNIHSPSHSSVLNFMHGTDFSNVLPVGDAFYFVQRGQLFRADITRGETPVKTLQYCGQAWLEKNEGYAIIIDCEGTSMSIVYVPQEWSSAYAIKHGGWENENVYLRPCYDTNFAFSVDKTTVTLYDIRNDFKTKVALAGNPDIETLICSRNGSNLVLINHDKNCNCWQQHSLTEQYQIETLKIIPYSEGMLPPLAVGKNIVSQNPLLFNPTKFLLPAEQQLFFDPHNNIVHPKITDDTVVFHAGIPANTQDSPIVKPISSNNDPENNSGTHVLVYVLVVLVLLILVMAGIFLVYIYKKRKRIYDKIFRR